MSGAGAMGFRWVEVVEKEFDKAFVDLDLLLGEIDEDQLELVLEGRDRLSRLSTAFAQLCHKSQSIFQHNSHLETQLVTLRSEVCQLRSLKTVQERQINDLVYQIHDAQLQLCQLKEYSEKDASSPLRNGLVDPQVIRQKLADHKISAQVEGSGERETLELRRQTEELDQVKRENAVWKQQALTLRGEVLGAKLASKYTAKELSGRVQQLQLLIREKEMKLNPEMQQKLWNQLEAEINLHRHKTIIRECKSAHLQQGSNGSVQNGTETEGLGKPTPGELRTAVIMKKEHQKNLGVSITGGREHGVPVLISEIHPDTAAADCGNLFVGDAILFVNGKDLREVPHENAVKILSEAAAQREVTLEVLFIHPDPDELALREGESRAEVEKELSKSEYPIFDPSLLRFKGLTVQTNDEYNGLDSDPRFWGPTESHPPYEDAEPPNLVIDEGGHGQHQWTQQQHPFQANGGSHSNLQAVLEGDASDGNSSQSSAVVTVTETTIPTPANGNSHPVPTMLARYAISQSSSTSVTKEASPKLEISQFIAPLAAKSLETPQIVASNGQLEESDFIDAHFSTTAPKTDDKVDAKASLDADELTEMTRIGSRLSQHSNSQMIEFAQFQRPDSSADGLTALEQGMTSMEKLKEPADTTLMEKASLQEKRKMEQRQGHSVAFQAPRYNHLKQESAALQVPIDSNCQFQPKIDHSIPSIIPNDGRQLTEANLNAHSQPTSSVNADIPRKFNETVSALTGTLVSSLVPQTSSAAPQASASMPMASSQATPASPPQLLPTLASAIPTNVSQNSFSQFVYPYPMRTINGSINPLPYPVGGTVSQDSSDAPCAYPYPRNRDEILKGAMMLSPSSIDGYAGGGGVSRYYLPPQGTGEGLNQSPPPLGYKNRDTKILY